MLRALEGKLNLTGVLRAGVLARDIGGERVGVPGMEVALLEYEDLRGSAVGGTVDQPNRDARMAVSEGGSGSVSSPAASSEFIGIL